MEVKALYGKPKELRKRKPVADPDPDIIEARSAGKL
jgi:hypothetical protein